MDKAVAELLELAKKHKHDEVKARLAKLDRAQQREFKVKFNEYKASRRSKSSSSLTVAPTSSSSSSLSSSSSIASSSSSSRASRPRRVVGRARVLFDYVPSAKSGSTSLAENDVVDLLEREAGDLWRVQFCGRKATGSSKLGVCV